MDFVVIVILGFIFGWFLYSKLNKSYVDRPTEKDISMAKDITSRSGDFLVEVVGQYYDEATHSPIKKPEDQFKFGNFLLYPEKRNNDESAVSVWLDNKFVGYLQKVDAITYRSLYDSKPTRSLGLIHGGKLNDTVWLDIDLKHNEEPTSKSVIKEHFPMLAINTEKYRANLELVMESNTARMVMVEIHKSDSSDWFNVLVANKIIAEIHKDQATYYGGNIPGRAHAMIIKSNYDYIVRVSNQIIKEEEKTYSYE